MKRRFFWGYLVGITMLVSCQKESETPVPSEEVGVSGTVLIRFKNVVGDKDLSLNTSYINPASGEDFVIHTYNYIISNIKLKSADGKVYAIPLEESYFFISESTKESQTITLSNIPSGTYSEITYTIGVDSTRSAVGLSSIPKGLIRGVGAGMYWSWNSGYIFFMLEGDSSVAPKDNKEGDGIMYHIGGFMNPINNIRTKTFAFPQTGIVVSKNRPAEIIFKTDVLKVFNGPFPLRIANKSVVMFDPISTQIMENIEQAFRLDSIKNP